MRTRFICLTIVCAAVVVLTDARPVSARQARQPNILLIVPLLKEPDAPWDHPAITQVRRDTAKAFITGYSIRTDRSRYTEWDNSQRGTELYNELEDPDELKNLAADPEYASVIEQMQQMLRRTIRP